MEENNKPEFGTRETGMFVPEGFFAGFQKNLEEKIDQKVQRHITIRRWSIAASICLLLGLAPVAYSIFNDEPAAQQTEPEVTYAEVESEDINTEEIMYSIVSDLDIYENFYADL